MNLHTSLQNVQQRATSLVLALAFLVTIGGMAMPPAKAAAATMPINTGAKVSFTFDDGLNSAVTQAAPTLAKYGFTGTDYVITKCIGMTAAPNTCHANTDAAYMSWDQVTQLKAAGWEIGSHTQSHPYLASSDAGDGQPNVLTPAQVAAELNGAKTDLAAHGITATDFATPYGDWTHPVLSQIAQTYASHRGFADNIDQNGDGVIDHGNTFPYNDYLLYDYQVQAGVTVAQVKSMIDQTRANNQWLILTFHNISPTASTNPDDYEYNTADLDQIAAYVKSLSMPVVNVQDALPTNAGNLLPNGSFDTALSSNTADTTTWSTDDPANIKQNTAGNGSYPSPANSVALNGSTKDTHLFSPQAAIDPAKAYLVKDYLNVNAVTLAAGHEIAFYVDEYDASGNYLSTQYKRSETSVWLEDLNFEYKPTSTSVTKARLQVVVTANSGISAYLDNVQWFAEDGSTTGTPVTPPPVIGTGDVNGDSVVNALDLSIVLSNWDKTGVTAAQGDLNGDGTINALDLSTLLTNWSK